MTDKNSLVRLTTSLGTLDVQLDWDKAPNTCENFAAYIESGHYNSTLFHRCIPGFMIQGGGFDPDMQQKSTLAAIQNEADNGLQNLRGTLAMARTGDPHSATCQFFINVTDNHFLNYQESSPQGYGYCVFGKVIKGEDVIDSIVSVPTGNRNGHGDVPVDNVVIESANFVKA